jgi:hypothetical protein
MRETRKRERDETGDERDPAHGESLAPILAR